MANIYSPGNNSRNLAYSMSLGSDPNAAYSSLLNRAYSTPGTMNTAYSTNPYVHGTSGSGGSYAGSSSVGYPSGGGGSPGGGGGGGSPGGGMSTAGLPSFIQEYQRRFDQANAANESRYQDINSRYSNLYGRAMDSVNQGNAQAVDDINSASQTRQGGLSQDLISRGLTGSTLRPTLSAGLDRERVRDVNRSNADYNTMRRNTDIGLTNEQSNFMERRTDQAPDISQLIALSQAYGSANGGQGGGGQGGGVYSGMGDGGYGSARGTPYAGLQSALGNVFGGFAGNSMHAGIANTSRMQGNNTQAAYQRGGSMSGGSFNGGYSNLGNSGAWGNAPRSAGTGMPYGDADYYGYYNGSR